MTTQEWLPVDAHSTWKPYRVAYEVIKATRERDVGSVVEVIAKDDQGLLNYFSTWRNATGYELLDTKPSDGTVRLLVRTGEPKHGGRTMTVIMSTAGLQDAVDLLDKALAGAVLGMNVNMVFEGAAVRLLKHGYRSRLSGLAGGLFTSMVERVMSNGIGWPLPQQSIRILDDLGARIYICSPSMYGYGVKAQDLIVSEYALGAVVTWADLLARSDIQILSKARFDKP